MAALVMEVPPSKQKSQSAAGKVIASLQLLLEALVFIKIVAHSGLHTSIGGTNLK